MFNTNSADTKAITPNLKLNLKYSDVSCGFWPPDVVGGTITKRVMADKLNRADRHWD